MVTRHLVLLIAGVLSVAAMSAAEEARAQCYPGLACPTGTAPQNAQESQPAPAAPSAKSSLNSGPAAETRTSGVTVAPSFTCNESKSASELIVCQNQELAVLDIKLNAAYGGVQSRMTAAELKLLRDQQRIWVKERDKCGADVGCIKTLYVARLEQLSAH